MSRRKRNFHYEYESHNTHGRMKCQICGKKIEKGSSYRWWETTDAYLSEHRSCTQDDPEWAKLDKQKQEALKILPDDLVPIFDELLEHYKFAALKCHGRAMVSPLVIAELVLLGWRNAEDERQPKNSEELI